MKALVLAAGKGSRLLSAAAGMPKPLVDVGGVTPLELNLAAAAAFGVELIWINVHQGSERVTDRVGPSFRGTPVLYSHEPLLLGTAGAWKKLEREWTTTTLVLYGDNFMRFDLAALLRSHRTSGCPMTVALFDPAIHRNTGIGGGRAQLSDGRITEFVEGGDTGLVNAGAYFIEPELAKELHTGFLDFGRDVLPILAEQGRLAAHVVEDSGYCLGLDTPERLAIARDMVATLEVRP